MKTSEVIVVIPKLMYFSDKGGGRVRTVKGDKNPNVIERLNFFLIRDVITSCPPSVLMFSPRQCTYFIQEVVAYQKTVGVIIV